MKFGRIATFKTVCGLSGPLLKGLLQKDRSLLARSGWTLATSGRKWCGEGRCTGVNVVGYSPWTPIFPLINEPPNNKGA